MIAIGMAREYPPKLNPVEPAPVSRDEIPEYVEAAYSAFHHDPPDTCTSAGSACWSPSAHWSCAIAAGSSPERGSSPAGSPSPAARSRSAGVTLVGVRPTHRRRGLLTTLMRRQLADLHDAGREPVAALWASEPVIYGRFGYGLATFAANLEVRAREVQLRRTSTAQVDLLGPADALDAMRPVYEAVRPGVPGMLDRDGPWWEDRLRDHESDRDGAQPLLAAVTEDAYALYAVKPWFTPAGPAGEVRVREVVAASDEGVAAIWGFLLGLDLITKLTWDLAPSDDPLAHMVVNAQDVRFHSPTRSGSAWSTSRGR